jgi:GT2 family glycosyltransferase
MAKFSVVTPVWNKANMTMEFITNLRPYLGADGELIIVDNGSEDAINHDLVSKFLGQQFQYLRLDRNYGFGKALNRGIEKANGEFLFQISNDVTVIGDPFYPVIRLLELEAKTLVGHRIVDWDSGWNTFKESGVIAYCEGYFIASRKDKFEAVGGWDEAMFTDYEDVELSYRWKRQMGVIVQLPQLPVRHIGGITAQQLPGGREKYTLESQKYFMNKWNLTLRSESESCPNCPVEPFTGKTYCPGCSDAGK